MGTLRTVWERYWAHILFVWTTSRVLLTRQPRALHLPSPPFWPSSSKIRPRVAIRPSRSRPRSKRSCARASNQCPPCLRTPSPPAPPMSSIRPLPKTSHTRSLQQVKTWRPPPVQRRRRRRRLLLERNAKALPQARARDVRRALMSPRSPP